LAELKTAETLFGYKMAATPTTLATLALALERYGTLDLAQALAPAIEIGESGYRLSQNYLAWTDLYLDYILTSNYLRFVVLDHGLVSPLEKPVTATVIPIWSTPCGGSQPRELIASTAAP